MDNPTSSNLTASTSRQTSDYPEEEEEDVFINSKGIQAGRGTPYKGKAGKNKKKRATYTEKDEEELCEIDDKFSVDLNENCTSHSFCIVETLKRKGVYPVQPKGFPWASGRLLYLPGQRPKHYEPTKQELIAIDKRKKKKKVLQKHKKRMMNKLREGDHTKLCDVMTTTQELMLLMRIITMVMEKKKIERRKMLAEIQTVNESPEEIENELGIEFEGYEHEDEGEEEDYIPNE